MISPDLRSQYWLATDGRVFSVGRNALVAPSDAAYAAWCSACVPLVWPTDSSGNESNAALYVVLVSYGLGSALAPPPSQTDLITYAGAKQITFLSTLNVIYKLSDKSSTLTTMCDPLSITFMNSLAGWATMSASASPAPTRNYYNLDGTLSSVTPAQISEFLNVVGAKIQATFDAFASVRAAITAESPTISALNQIDGFAWPK